jgi:hypothetical protein
MYMNAIMLPLRSRIIHHTEPSPHFNLLYCITMSSVFVPSIIASACPTEVTGTPSEIATVKGLPSVCSIATLQETADEPVMTSSDSLHPRGTAKGGTE